MSEKIFTLPEGSSVYKVLLREQLWKNLSFAQQESFSHYETGDRLIIDKQKQKISLQSNGDILKINYHTHQALQNHKIEVGEKKYNDQLLGYKKNLSGSQIQKLFGEYNQREQKIEKLIRSGKILNYLQQKVVSQINIQGDGYLCYVDTNLQRSFLIHFHKGQLQIIGYVKVSTGNAQRNHQEKIPGQDKYWNTPQIIIEMKKGVWESDPSNGETYGGYGKKGSRVFSLGNYSLKNGISIKNENNILDLALAMHKTSLEGEKNLGKAMSHGCIRIGRIMIDILDNIESQNLFKYTIIGDYKKNQSPIIPK